ncbi:hypothetical protein PWT90_02310 [Aphanocladium album]|nr:hypothetical protein PWT90_02310 [Aphanocladium album]
MTDPRGRAFRSRPQKSDNGDHKQTLRQVRGPISFLNPTQGRFEHEPGVSAPADGGADDPGELVDGETKEAAARPPIKHHASPDGVHFLWRSRDNRKGRHPLRVHRPPGGASTVSAPRRSTHPKEVLKGVIRTFTQFPAWDISWLVAFMFTIGSVVWVINGFFAWLPLVRPSTEFQNESLYGGGITAFVGAILFFETGSLLLILEAINTNDTDCFGWAVEELTAADRQADHASSSAVQYVANKETCRHHHQNKRNLVGKPQPTAAAATVTTSQTRHWQWWPSWRDLTHHYVYELGFLAGAAQLFGATVFGVAGFTALPGIMNHLTPQWRLNAAFWIPQVVGGSGFVVSGLLYMLETQDRWWKPTPRLLGWHIAFWNLIGAFGFTLCGALGMAYGNSGAQYQASLATFCHNHNHKSPVDDSRNVPPPVSATMRKRHSDFSWEVPPCQTHRPRPDSPRPETDRTTVWVTSQPGSRYPPRTAETRGRRGAVYHHRHQQQQRQPKKRAPRASSKSKQQQQQQQQQHHARSQKKNKSVKKPVLFHGEPASDTATTGNNNDSSSNNNNSSHSTGPARERRRRQRRQQQQAVNKGDPACSRPNRQPSSAPPPAAAAAAPKLQDASTQTDDLMPPPLAPRRYCDDGPPYPIPPRKYTLVGDDDDEEKKKKKKEKEEKKRKGVHLDDAARGMTARVPAPLCPGLRPAPRASYYIASEQLRTRAKHQVHHRHNNDTNESSRQSSSEETVSREMALLMEFVGQNMETHDHDICTGESWI